MDKGWTEYTNPDLDTDSKAIENMELTIDKSIAKLRRTDSKEKIQKCIDDVVNAFVENWNDIHYLGSRIYTHELCYTAMAELYFKMFECVEESGDKQSPEQIRGYILQMRKRIGNDPLYDLYAEVEMEKLFNFKQDPAQKNLDNYKNNSPDQRMLGEYL